MSCALSCVHCLLFTHDVQPRRVWLSLPLHLNYVVAEKNKIFPHHSFLQARLVQMYECLPVPCSSSIRNLVSHLLLIFLMLGSPKMDAVLWTSVNITVFFIAEENETRFWTRHLVCDFFVHCWAVEALDLNHKIRTWLQGSENSWLTSLLEKITQLLTEQKWKNTIGKCCIKKLEILFFHFLFELAYIFSTVRSACNSTENCTTDYGTCYCHNHKEIELKVFRKLGAKLQRCDLYLLNPSSEK